MEILIPLLVLLAVISVLSGPIALIVSLIVLNRIKQIQQGQEATAERTRRSKPAATEPRAEVVPAPTGRPAHIEAIVPRAEDTRAGPVTKMTKAVSVPPPFVEPCPQASLEAAAGPIRKATSLEQRIGTRWVLIAGVITVIFAVGFFLKYAYDKQWIGPLGRAIIAGVAGFVALIVGEVTRRRGYDIVAKGVTALGFAILYATVFAAHRWYGLIGSVPAYVLAISITIAAMLYAVALNEIVAALLALIGGYVTPMLLSTGQNLPTPLFIYTLILGAGAMLCAYWRKWGPVNILAFAGTFVLYTGWFEKFYRPTMGGQLPPEQLGTALFWLAVFFLVYLILPLLQTLVKRVKSETQDMVLVLANAAVVFYYLWTILSHEYRTALAGCSLVMGAAYLVLMGLVMARCREDPHLRQALLAAGLAFVTLAAPLYFKMYAVGMTWAVEGVVLAVIGLRYRSTLTQAAAGAVLALTVGKLALSLPMHDAPFRVILNPPFGTWVFAAAAVIVCHLLCRFDSRLDPEFRRTATEVLYAVGLLLLMVAVSMELWHHGDLNVPKGRGGAFFREQMVLVIATFLLLFAARPLRPRGPLSRIVAALVGDAGSFYLVFAYVLFHEHEFTIFLNGQFVRALALIATLFAAAWLLRRPAPERGRVKGLTLSAGFGLGGILVLWILLTQEIWFYFRLSPPGGNWQFLAQMYISVTWAIYATGLMVIGFWRRIRMLRYVALGIFLLLLAKIFILDTRTVETIYRIAGFLVTGIALVAVSYLYQNLKKKGFFDTMLVDESTHTGIGDEVGSA